MPSPHERAVARSAIASHGLLVDRMNPRARRRQAWPAAEKAPRPATPLSETKASLTGSLSLCACALPPIVTVRHRRTRPALTTVLAAGRPWPRTVILSAMRLPRSARVSLYAFLVALRIALPFRIQENLMLVGVGVQVPTFARSVLPTASLPWTFDLVTTENLVGAG